MNVADVMDDIAARLRSMANLRVFAYPPDHITPPAAIVTYPGEYNYDETYQRGIDRMTVPVILLIGRASDRASRDELSNWFDRSGAKRYKVENVGQLTKFTFSTDGNMASTPAVVGGNLQITATGSVQGFSNLRDAYIRTEIVGADFHCKATFDPPFFGDPDAGGPLNSIFPQHAIIMRFQRDTTQRAVFVWQNIFFGLPSLLAGVWKSNLDGTGFTNRQAPNFPAPFGLTFPYTVECRLTGKFLDIRQWHVGDQVPDWHDPVLARRFDLDNDAGDATAIPTPTGQGNAGVAAAHLGNDTSPPSMVRYPLADLYFEVASKSLKDTIESGSYSAFDVCRVQSAQFDVLEIAGVDYLAANLSLDVVGNGV